MAIKLTTHHPVTEQDVISAAESACEAYDKLMQCGYELQELSIVVENMRETRSIIAQNGAEWYFENCDVEGALCKAIESTKTSIDTSKVDVAIEGLLGDFWEKLKEYFEKLSNWLKSVFSSKKGDSAKKDEAEAKQNVSDAEKKTSDEKKALEEKLDEKEIPSSGSKIVNALATLSSKQNKEDGWWSKLKKGAKAFFSIDTLVTVKNKLKSCLEWCGKHVPSMKDLLQKVKSCKTKEDYDQVYEVIVSMKNEAEKNCGEIIDIGSDGNVIYADDAGNASYNAYHLNNISAISAAVNKLQGCGQIAYTGDNVGQNLLAITNEVTQTVKSGVPQDEAAAQSRAKVLQTLGLYYAYMSQTVLGCTNAVADIAKFEKDLTVPLISNKNAE